MNYKQIKPYTSMNSKIKIKIAVSLLTVVVLFIIVSILVRQNLDFFHSLIESHYVLGIFVFIFLEIISIVAAPITSLPIIPIASNTYGILLTSLFYFIGGVIGSIIAFFIGKKFRNNLLGKIVSLEDIELIEKAIPKKNYFWTLVLMRIVIPPDVLSYTLGIATSTKYNLFIWTTVIGTIPSAFFFSSLGVLPLPYQIIGWIFGVAVLIALLKILFRKKLKNKS